MSTFRNWLIPMGLLTVLSLLCIGCGRPNEPLLEVTQRDVDRWDLKAIGIAYFDYCGDCDKNMNGPADTNDLRNISTETERLMQRVEKGDFIVNWNVSVCDTKAFEPQGQGGTILAYEARTPTGGGFILMADGSVKSVTADEFDRTPKANGAVGGKPK